MDSLEPPQVYIESVATSFREVHMQVRVRDKSFLLNAIYASPIYSRRKKLWDSFKELAPQLTLPWLLIEDLNDIAKPSKKFGGCPPSQQKINNFNSFRNSYGLIDLGYLGSHYTWTNCRNNREIVRTHID